MVKQTRLLWHEKHCGTFCGNKSQLRIPAKKKKRKKRKEKKRKKKEKVIRELHAHRGLLTGKFTREEGPTEGRLGWVAQNESRSSHSHPAWSKVKDNDKVWNILDTCKKVADAHGESGADLGSGLHSCAL